MIKVVGFDPKQTFRATCLGCSAINEYTKIDVVTLWSSTDYGGGPEGAEGFKCAHCGTNVITKSW